MIKLIIVLGLKSLIILLNFGPIVSNSFNNNIGTNKGDSIKNVRGEFFVFPSGELIKDLDLTITFNDSLSFYNIDCNLSGKFFLQSNFNGIANINIRFSDPNFRKKEEYYPIEIKNVRIDNDSINLGIIPIIVDSFGYYEEMGIYRKNKYNRRSKNYWTINIMNMDSRLMVENELNNIYKLICKDCKPIFITESHSQEDKKTFSYWELRKFEIEYSELKRISEFFISRTNKDN